MNEIININVNTNNEQQTVSARELYGKLDITDRFSRWFDSILKYGFINDIDFTSVKTSTLVNNGAERELQDYQITIEMAKQICMLQRSEKGKLYREYFLKIERAWNTPEAVMARALQVANKTLDNLKIEVENQQKIIQEQKPKIEVYNRISNGKGCFTMNQTAKALCLPYGNKTLIKKLKEMQILNEDKTPRQQYLNLEYFKVVIKNVENIGNVSVTLTTSKGLIYLAKRFNTQIDNSVKADA